jgi:hypothetical protein
MFGLDHYPVPRVYMFGLDHYPVPRVYMFGLVHYPVPRVYMFGLNHYEYPVPRVYMFGLDHYNTLIKSDSNSHQTNVASAHASCVRHERRGGCGVVI